MPAYKDTDGRWRFRFTYKGVRYSGSTPKGHNTAGVARQLERDMIETLQARAFTGVMPTVEAFSIQFLDYQRTNTKPLTAELHETVIRIHVNPHIGKMKLDEVTKATLSMLVQTWLAGGAADRTANTRMGVLQRMLSLALEWELLTAIPKIKPLKIAIDHPRFLNEDEARRLLDAAPPNWRTMMLVALRTGLRIGELRGLQWTDVDLKGGVLHVRRTDPGRPDLEASAPKSGRPRTVPMTAETVTALRDWRARADTDRATKLVFPGVEEWRDQHDRTRARAEGSCAAAIGRAAERAKLDDWEEITWHTLRHTYASWLVMRGIPLRAVQDLLGHANLKMTERYAHLAPGFTNRALVASLDVPLVTTSDLGEPDPRGSAAPASHLLPAAPAPPAAPRQGAAKAKTTPRRRPRKEG